MDTKVRRRRAAPSGTTPRRSSGGANRTSGTKRAASGTRNPRPASGTARRTAGTGSRDARRRTSRAPEQARRQRRVVRPPKEDIPAVVYTMPQPFRRSSFLLKLVSVVAVVAALMMALSLFFRVEEVVVSGTEKYTPWMIKEASGISDGDSLLGISDARVTGNIISKLPYVKYARVGIKLPGTVHIEIVELDMTYAIQARDGSWWLIAADGRVVEQIETTASAGYTRIFGVQADAPRVEQQVQAAEHADVPPETPTDETEDGGVTLPTVAQITGAQRLDAVLTILAALEENGVIGQIASIDVTNLNDISMEYGQRLHVVLGTAENLEYKVTYMAQAVQQIEEYQTGELDVSFKYSDKALLNPES